ncbi:MAG: M48 family metalloprotease [Planctomycetaceae bacterium]|nr:M48 family metalloprotease [Planctomycetaceae bacterium]
MNVQCPQCQNRSEVPDSLAGRKVRCAKCQAVHTLQPVEEVSATPQSPPPLPPPLPAKPVSPPPLPPVTVTSKTVVTPDDFLAELEALSQHSHASQQPKESREEVLKVRRQLLKTLDGQLAVSEVPATYRVAVFFVGTLMCLLALVYIGMIVGGFVGMYQYAAWLFNHFGKMIDSLSGSDGKVSIFAFAVPFIPFLAIGAVLFFMIKPFLFGWSWKDERFELTREREPFLFDFLDKLSGYVGAIPPTRVFVDCNVNAAASFRHGIWSALFGGRHCDLTLGLPLVAGMTMSQLAGVIAHEFGHFTQGGGMRFGNIIRTITYWFLRVVYGRDRVDQFLIAFSTSGHVFNIIVFMIVRIFVWLARFVLWCLMMIGFAVSGFLSRQMEFDADQFEARIIGSKSFRRSTRRLLGLGISNAKSNYDINQLFKDELLVDDYPRLIAANAEIIADKLDKWVDEHITQNQKTGWFDTHPSDAARIEQAESLEAEGVLHLDCPATYLFDNFNTLAREVTWHYYTVENQLDIKQSSLKNIDIVVGELKAEANRGKTVGRYYQGLFRDRIAEALPPQSPVAPANPTTCKAEIKAIRERMLKIREPLEKKLVEISNVENDVWQLRVVTLLQNCKGHYAGLFTPEPPQRRYNDNLMKKHQLEFELQEKVEKTEPEFKLLAKRLHHALSLLMLDPVMRRIKDGETLRHRAELLYPLGVRLSQLYKKFFSLYQQRILVVMLYYSLQKVAQKQVPLTLHETEIKNINDALFEGLNAVCNELSEMPYPFDHAQGKVTIKTALAPNFDGTNHDLGALVDAAEAMHERFGMLLGRIYLELVSMAETVETTIGLPLLPDLPEKEEEKEPEKKKGLFSRLRSLFGAGK